jgi:hypothetical protein
MGHKRGTWPELFSDHLNKTGFICLFVTKTRARSPGNKLILRLISDKKTYKLDSLRACARAREA